MNLASTRIDVLIADRDHMEGQLMASALRRCRNQFDVVVVTTDSTEAIGSLNIYKPHVALVSPDLEDETQTGFKVLQTLRATHPETAGIMMLHSVMRDSVVASFRAGARGIFCRADSFKALAKCIRRVHEGKIWAGTRIYRGCPHTLETSANQRELRYGPAHSQRATRRYPDWRRNEESGDCAAPACRRTYGE
jgi:DNA-binding NarL/FixJ family response regulator